MLRCHHRGFIYKFIFNVHLPAAMLTFNVKLFIKYFLLFSNQWSFVIIFLHRARSRQFIAVSFPFFSLPFT